MNSIITLRRLVEMMAKKANLPEPQIEQFIKAMTALVTEELMKGEAVTINGVGEFKLSPTRKVLFVPDAELAREVNSPFDIFQPEPLAQGITMQELEKPIQKAEPEVVAEEPEAIIEEATESIETETIVEETTERIETETIVEEATESIEPEAVVEEVPETIEEPKTTPTLSKVDYAEIFGKDEPEEEEEGEKAPESDPEPEEDEYYPETEERGGFPTFWVIIALLVGLILGVGIGFFMHGPIEKLLEPSLAENEATEENADDIAAELDLYSDLLSNDDNAEASSAEPAATPQSAAPAETPKKEEPKPQAAPAAPAAQSSQVVYETIKPGVFLSTLAKKHYNEKTYWVYIYLENQSIIKNPNRVPEGTRLVIPPIEKYATQATQEERLEAARKKVSEVLKKYPN